IVGCNRVEQRIVLSGVIGPPGLANGRADPFLDHPADLALWVDAGGPDAFHSRHHLILDRRGCSQLVDASASAIVPVATGRLLVDVLVEIGARGVEVVHRPNRAGSADKATAWQWNDVRLGARDIDRVVNMHAANIWHLLHIARRWRLSDGGD